MNDKKTIQQLEEERQRINDEYEKYYDETGNLADDWRDAAHREIDNEIEQLKKESDD
jgi:hypothetical protein